MSVRSDLLHSDKLGVVLLWLVVRISWAFKTLAAWKRSKISNGEKRSKGKILKVHWCVVGGKFKGGLDQQRVGTLKSFNDHTVEPSWPQISVEVRDAEENDTTLPSAEHEGADDGWVRLWFLRPVNQHSYLTTLWHHVSGPPGCEYLEKPCTAGGGFSFRTLKRQRAACYSSSIMLNTLLVPLWGEVHGVTSGSAQWQHGKRGNLYVCECFFSLPLSLLRMVQHSLRPTNGIKVEVDDPKKMLNC